MHEDIRRSILIAEDSDEVREVLARWLAFLGLRCEKAANGREALRLFGNGGRFLCVVTDLDMPGLSGLDLVREIKERAPEVPVVLISAFLGPETSREALERGAAAALDKDEGIATLARRIEGVVAAAWKRA